MSAIEKLQEALINRLKSGVSEADEGNIDGRNRLGSGHLRRYKTYPKPEQVSVTISQETGRGVISYPYECRVRTEYYELGGLIRTEDSQAPGIITADFAASFDCRTVQISNLRPVNQSGNCGNVIVSLLNSISGQNLV
ncbi:hypothetical protein MOE37_07660 [Bacillus atrophaeus]|uniref:hypothetical protein n=1 Tax=Bacillus atrophaeus TaxID=1452 RepID=UPI00227E9542|nr:hypothetical protein [Bacillus atrophaeus]MCY8971466.1 hypothetical protein [Bacillus atrophaeus]